MKMQEINKNLEEATKNIGKAGAGVNTEYFCNAAKRFGHAIVGHDHTKMNVLNAVEVIAEYCTNRYCDECAIGSTNNNPTFCNLRKADPCYWHTKESQPSRDKSFTEEHNKRVKKECEKHDIPIPKPKIKYWIWTIYGEHGVYTTTAYFSEEGKTTDGRSFNSQARETWDQVRKEKTSIEIEV